MFKGGKQELPYLHPRGHHPSVASERVGELEQQVNRRFDSGTRV